MSGYITTSDFSSFLRQIKNDRSESNSSIVNKFGDFAESIQNSSPLPRRPNPFSIIASKGELNNEPIVSSESSNEKTTQIAPLHAQTKEIQVIAIPSVKIAPETSPVETVETDACEPKTQLPSSPSK